MKLPLKTIAQILIKNNYVEKADLITAINKSRISNHSFIDILFDDKLITKDLLGQAIAEYFKVEYADLNTNIPTKEEVLIIPEKIARKFNAVLFKETSKKVIITTDNPKQSNLVSTITKHFKETQGLDSMKKIVINYSLPDDITTTLRLYKKSFKDTVKQLLRESNSPTQFLDELLGTSISEKVSDIHFEPNDNDVIIRIRIDGVLSELTTLSKEFYEKILNKIKVLAKLRIDEHFSAQDGAIRYNNTSIDLRISIIPTLNGEKIVIRILSKYIQTLGLDSLGISNTKKNEIIRSVHKPYGMVLVCGPTGSGKTTTLYSVLNEINNDKINITTIEDSVEYRIKGINQIQVNPNTNLTFAKGLRSIVRQDPDVMLVGEIRDKETAEIAINAALTGHLLLSTFHTNDAASAIPRLIDMKIEPFLLASTLNIIIAQRLVRRVCEHCKVSKTYSSQELIETYPREAKYFKGGNITLYHGKGCSQCNNLGYKGRTAIFEYIIISDDLKELIAQKPTSTQIWQLAKNNGSTSLFVDGINKVKMGITTIEEITRVAEFK